jgi:hypothetical protein
MRLTRQWRWMLPAVAWLVAGCGAGWRQVAVAPTALASEPQEVRVTLDDGSRLVLSAPRFEHDSLFGEVDGRPRALAMTDVKRLALPQASSSKRSAGTVAVISAIVVFVAGWAWLALR